MTTTFIGNHEHLHPPSMHPPRGYPPARSPRPSGDAPGRAVSRILEMCLFVAQEYAAMAVFIKNPYQIYQLDRNSRKYSDEILAILFKKFDGDIQEILRVSEKLPSAQKLLSRSYKGRAAGRTMGLPNIDYSLKRIVNTATAIARGEMSEDEEDDNGDVGIGGLV